MLITVIDFEFPIEESESPKMHNTHRNTISFEEQDMHTLVW